MEKVERKSLGYYSSSSTYISDASKLQRIERDWREWGLHYKSGNYKFKWRPFGDSREIRVNRVLLPLIIEVFGDKCAFCNYGPIYNHPSANYYTLEHFKPKGKGITPNYSEYAYQWENLYPCCKRCNEEKDKKFSTLLLRPDDSSYDFDTHFKVDGSGKLIDKTPKASKTICLYKLNRPSLINDRRNKIEELELFFQKLGEVPEKFLKKKPYQFYLTRVLKSLEATNHLNNLGDIISVLEEN